MRKRSLPVFVWIFFILLFTVQLRGEIKKKEEKKQRKLEKKKTPVTEELNQDQDQ